MSSILIVRQYKNKPGSEELAHLIKSYRDKELVFGIDVKDEGILNVIATESEASARAEAALQQLLGPALYSLRIPFERSPAANEGSAPFPEFVASYFPMSKIAAPGFQQQIESDFHKFDAGIKEVSPSYLSLAYGWSEETVHPDFVEKCKAFFVIRDYQSMEDFYKVVGSEDFGRVRPILISWGAPYKMWHVKTLA